MQKSEYIIVLVDDDREDQAILQEIFAIHSDAVRILNVPDGKEALDLLRRLKQKNVVPCLIILDINMPRLDGRETLLQIKADADLNAIPAILFSTSSNEEDISFAHAQGVEYVIKPFSYKKLENVVKGFIARCELETEKRAQA